MACREAIQNLLEFCLSFGPPKEGRRALIKKNGERTEWKCSTAKCEETPLEECGRGVGVVVKIPRDFSCMTVPYRNCWMHLSEYMVRAWLDQRYTPFTCSWSTSEERKKWSGVCISNQGYDIDRMVRYRIVKAGVWFRWLLSKTLRGSSQFCEIQTGSIPCNQDKNYQKMGIKY